jgi:hypothetical protein
MFLLLHHLFGVDSVVNISVTFTQSSPTVSQQTATPFPRQTIMIGVAMRINSFRTL